MSVSNDIVSTKLYNKRDDFDLEIVNFLFSAGDVPPMEFIFLNSSNFLEHLAMLQISTLAQFLIQKLLKRGYWFHIVPKVFVLNFIADTIIPCWSFGHALGTLGATVLWRQP